MPRYVYSCDECGVTYQRVHSIKERLTDCEECEMQGTLKRIPSMPVVLAKEQGPQKRPTGSLVKEYIENVREDLQDEKEQLKRQVYKDD